jgi:hypothetical protein
MMTHRVVMKPSSFPPFDKLRAGRATPEPESSRAVDGTLCRYSWAPAPQGHFLRGAFAGVTA